MPPVQVKARGGPVRPVAPDPARPAPTNIIPPIQIVGLQGVSPVMVSSMPSIASGYDAYMRQFYRAPGLPSRRYLPIRSQ